MKFLILLTMLVTSHFCFADSNINKIIDENNLVAIKEDASNIPVRYRGLLNAFGLMSMGCTATHIGNGFVLTAGHCFWAPETLMEDMACAGETISWGYREAKKPYLISNCERIIAAQRSALGDFAIIKVSPVPPVAIAPDMQRRAVPGDTLTIFSHPDELPLQWSHSCGVEVANYPDLSPVMLQHKCDTNPGSSGATLLNILTLKVVGIHDGGLGKDTFGRGMNYGTYIMTSPLYDVLLNLGFK